jgi:hypothetical protein
MTKPPWLFDMEELEKLDEKQLKILRRAIKNEVLTNPEIREILRRKLRPMYHRWSSQGSPPGAQGSGPSEGT